MTHNEDRESRPPELKELEAAMRDKWGKLNLSRLARAAGYADHAYVSRVFSGRQPLTPDMEKRLRAALDGGAPPTAALERIESRLEELATAVEQGFEGLERLLGAESTQRGDEASQKGRKRTRRGATRRWS